MCWVTSPPSLINWKTLLFVLEHITDLRNKLENKEAELRRKDRVISELEAKLDVAKVGNNNQAQIEDISMPAWNSYVYQIPQNLFALSSILFLKSSLNWPHLQKTMLAKDAEIKNLISDKEVWYSTSSLCHDFWLEVPMVFWLFWK